MALRYYANAPATTLAASCSSSQTSIEVASVTGLPIQYPYTLILDRGKATEEVVSVTNASGTTLTVTRAYDSTTAFSHAIGATVEHGISAIDPREANTHVNASTAVHGLSGAVVGDVDVQTLSNKDLTDPSNTFPSSLATDSELAAQKDVAETLTNKTIALGSNTVSGTKAQFNTAMTDADFATLDGTETLTNKTLTDPKVSDVYDTNGGLIVDLVSITPSDSRVEVTNGNSSGGAIPTVSSSGTPANIDLTLKGKGSGKVNIGGTGGLAVAGPVTATGSLASLGAAGSFSPTWTAATANPAIGSGSIVGSYYQVGKAVTFVIKITMAADTTFGTGQWRVGNLPVAPANHRQSFAVDLFDTSTGDLGGRAVWDNSISAFQIYCPSTTAGGYERAVMSNVPFTWATGDVLTITGTYLAA